MWEKIKPQDHIPDPTSLNFKLNSIDFFMKGGAIISDCKKYRYILVRQWNMNKPKIGWILLNPSIADATKTDPTLTRLLRRADKEGYGTLMITNLFALISSNPKILRLQDPHEKAIGKDNDKYIRYMLREVDTLALGWGIYGSFLDRNLDVKNIIREEHRKPMCLNKTNNGEPTHPLFQEYNKKLIPYWKND